MHMRVHRAVPVLAFVLLASLADAQVTNKPDSTQGGKYALVLYAGGGLSTYPMAPGVPTHLETHSTTLGPSGSLRLMWLPDHRLRVGFESGWTSLYSYDIAGPGPKGKVELVAVPLLLVWSMPLTDRFSIFAGYGTYRITSKLDYLGTTRSSTFSLGYSAALSYVYPISEWVGVDMEVKWFNATETRHTVLAAQAHLVWKLHHW
jgi:hypothetical protein